MKNIVRIGFAWTVIILCHPEAKSQAAVLALIFGDRVASESFHLSLDIGLNATSLPGLDQRKPTVGLNFGLGTFIKLNDRWALTPEFKPLSGRGARDVKSFYENVPLEDIQSNVHLNYIDVPVLVQYKATDRLFISIGPEISFVTEAKQHTSGTLSTGQEIIISETIFSLVNDIDLAVPLEVGYSLAKGIMGKAVDLKMRYAFGLTEVLTDKAQASSRNSTFQVMLSFPFIEKHEKKTK